CICSINLPKSSNQTASRIDIYMYGINYLRFTSSKRSLPYRGSIHYCCIVSKQQKATRELAKHFRPIPSTMKLADTLAQRVGQLREFRNMTVRDLAKASRFDVRRLEEIESGMETWFSSTERQLLAKALSVEPALLLEVERRSKPSVIEETELANT